LYYYIIIIIMLIVDCADVGEPSSWTSEEVELIKHGKSLL